jgi:hypothetical protein
LSCVCGLFGGDRCFLCRGSALFPEEEDDEWKWAERPFFKLLLEVLTYVERTPWKIFN